MTTPGHHKERLCATTDFDVLTFDMIGTLIDFEQGVLDFARPRLLRAKPEVSDTEILETYANVQSEVRTRAPGLLFSARLPKIWEGRRRQLRRGGRTSRWRGFRPLGATLAGILRFRGRTRRAEAALSLPEWW